MFLHMKIKFYIFLIGYILNNFFLSLEILSFIAII
jgi:hypothetical protein